MGANGEFPVERAVVSLLLSIVITSQSCISLTSHYMYLLCQRFIILKVQRRGKHHKL
jgi:hypothetical protein